MCVWECTCRLFVGDATATTAHWNHSPTTTTTAATATKKKWGGVRRVRAQNILRPFSVANFAPFWGEGGPKKLRAQNAFCAHFPGKWAQKRRKIILRPFSGKMGAKCILRPGAGRFLPKALKLGEKKKLQKPPPMGPAIEKWGRRGQFWFAKLSWQLSGGGP